MALSYDLVLKGGEVLDPSQQLRGKRDVAFKDGRVAAVADDIPREQGAEVIDLAGDLVVPGLMDLHGHFAYKLVPYFADPDPTNLPTGVTTAIDAGSTGWSNFPAFRSYVMERAETRLYAFIHLSSRGGMPGSLGIPDLEEIRYARVDEAVECIEGNRDLLLGVKVRVSPDGTTLKNALPALEIARQICDRTRSLLMVHVMDTPIPIAQVLEYMIPGDILTHIFHPGTHGALDESGHVRSEVRAAQESGIVLDTGSAVAHYSLPLSRTAIEEGLLPDAISTDVTIGWPNEPPGYDLPELMSVFLALGMSQEEVVKAVTVNVASAIGAAELGTLSVGSAGDAAVLRLEKGEFTYEDHVGNDVRTGLRFAPVLTVRNGKRWRPRP